MSDLEWIIEAIDSQPNWGLFGAEINNGYGCYIEIWKDGNEENQSEDNVIRLWFKEGGKFIDRW